VTIDEELTLLESQLRRLKIEYEVYFSNPTKKPPTDIEWKVLSLLRKHSGPVLIDFQVEQEDSVYPMVAAGASLHEMIRRPNPLEETAADA